ncbi:MAG: hypothetical protein LBT38_09940 [Deltaproteobacteria bacterium]|nr:hypothetical protein [Deltaproteobacteria bacterium]
MARPPAPENSSTDLNIIYNLGSRQKAEQNINQSIHWGNQAEANSVQAQKSRP